MCRILNGTVAAGALMRWEPFRVTYIFSVGEEDRAFFVCAACQRAAPNQLFFNGSALLKTDNELNVHQIYSCSGNHCNCAKAHWTIFSTDANPTALFSYAIKCIQELEYQFYRTGTQLWKYNGKLKSVITKASQYTETLRDARLISEEAIYNTIIRNPGVIIITALWN